MSFFLRRRSLAPASADASTPSASSSSSSDGALARSAAGKGKERASVSEGAPQWTSDILLQPLPGCTPRPRGERTEEQEGKKAALKEFAKTLHAALPPTDPYKPHEARFLADEGMYDRYMRAAKWDLANAKKRLQGTVEWRRDFKPDLIPPNDVAVEAESGKIILTGFDWECRPVLYLRAGRENTQPSERQIRHMVFALERAIQMMPPGVENIAIICDYKGAMSQSSPSLSTSKRVANILQNHYVERLGKGIVVNTPTFITLFFKLLAPFLDPITKEKIAFNPTMSTIVPPEHLDSEFAGGRYRYTYDYEKYWVTITRNLDPDTGARIDLSPPSDSEQNAAAQTTPAATPAAAGANDEKEARAAADNEEDRPEETAPASVSSSSALPNGGADATEKTVTETKTETETAAAAPGAATTQAPSENTEDGNKVEANGSAPEASSSTEKEADAEPEPRPSQTPASASAVADAHEPSANVQAAAVQPDSTSKLAGGGAIELEFTVGGVPVSQAAT